MKRGILVDTSALVALALPGDQNHQRARDLSGQAKGVPLAGTAAVLVETHRIILQRGGRARARDVVDALLNDPGYLWHDVTTELMHAAHRRWIDTFPDQAFSLADAVSFEVMRRERLDTAFTFDHHFVTAGYQLLT